jgi:putative MATE family efflux protein
MNKTKENKMGIMPIPKLIITMSLPVIFSMLVQALYNVVDSIFVSRISEEALTAVSLAFPLQIVVVAVFLGLGIGISSLIARKLGAKDHNTAVLVAEHGVLLGVFVFALVAILGSVFARNFYELFTENQTIIQYATEYTQIIMIFSFGRILAQAGMSVLQGSGQMVKPMIAQLIGAGINIILDPILIFGAFGFPKMGVSGAAIATVLAQIISMIYIWFELLKGNNIIKPKIRGFKFQWIIIKQIIAVGLPAALMQGLAAVMLGVLNIILSVFGDTALALMGAYFKIQSLVFMPIFGLSIGTMPIIGFNFGAKNKSRLLESILFSSKVAVIYMTVCLVIFQLFPENLLGIYNASNEMLIMGIPAIRTISLMFPLMAITIILSTAFQGIGKAHISLIVSIIRQIAIIIPAAFILSKLGGIDAVWYSFLIAEVVGVTFGLSMFISTYKKSIYSWES